MYRAKRRNGGRRSTVSMWGRGALRAVTAAKTAVTAAARRTAVAPFSSSRVARNGNTSEDGDDSSSYYVDVSNLAARWPTLSFEGQQDVISYLRVKQEFGWEYLSKDEKRAIYYIAYGGWGPRDRATMTGAEFAFRALTTALLFGVLGVTAVNYRVDTQRVAELEKEEEK